MPNLSTRGAQVPLSPFRKLIPFADEAKERGVVVHHLNIGQPDIATPSYALEALQPNKHPIISYNPGVGTKALRAAVAAYQTGRGIDLKSDNVLVTAGASEGIYFLLLACLAPGDNIIVPEPFYANYNGFAHMAGVEIKSITCLIEDEFMLPDVQEFEKLIDNRTKGIFITNPNNPTGCVYSLGTLRALGELVKKHDIYLFADEVYQDFCFTDERFTSILTLPDLEENCVVVDSVSKKYSACGARIGYIYTRNDEVYAALERLAKLRLSPPYLSELLALNMMKDDQSYIEASKQEYDRRRRVIYSRLSGMPGVQCYLPKGAFYCFAKFPIRDAEQFCQWLLESFDHQGETVMLSPGTGFYASPDRGAQEVRLAFVLNESDLHRAMDCLETGLVAYQKVEMATTGL